ncbi:MAG: SRPBCC family protein [Solirubrobacteraceae bacterium]
MIDFTIQTDIDRPVGDVFAYVTDPSKLHTWQTNTVSAMVVGGGPVGLGSRVVEVRRGPGGKELSQVVEFWEFEPDRRVSMRVVDGPVQIDGRLMFEPRAGGTRMSFNVYGNPGGPLRFAKPLMQWALKRQFAGHCATLKRVMEAEG